MIMMTITFITFTVFVLLTVLLSMVREIARFNQSKYKEESGKSYFSTLFNKGLYGEYQTVRTIEKINGYHKVLVNVYIPNEKGGTTEIDIIFLHETGIYIIESKNYSGWIFGREEDRKWCQSFPNGHKEFFYNPVKQNASHIRELKHLLHMVPKDMFKSVIVFSERCTLKKIHVSSPTVTVLKRRELANIWKGPAMKILSTDQIDALYMVLKRYTKVSEEMKRAHIEHVRTYRDSMTIKK